MSYITVCRRTETKSKVKIFDVSDVEREIDVILFEFSPQKDIVTLHVDYLGNVYLRQILSSKSEEDTDDTKQNEKYIYYIITPDSSLDVGIELTSIKNPNIFRKNLIESEFSKKAIKSGVLKTNKTTLRGKVYNSIKNMSSDEKEEYVDGNDFFAFDDSFKERQFYWVQYNEEDEPLEGEVNDSFYINNAVTENESKTKTLGIIYSDLLTLTPNTFDTIFISGEDGSKNVISTVERIDGYCSTRLTFYTSGLIRINFIDRIRDVRLCIDPITKKLIVNQMSN